jgi:hypothetical protein
LHSLSHSESLPCQGVVWARSDGFPVFFRDAGEIGWLRINLG